MELEKTKEIFESLKNDKKIVVEVIQNNKSVNYWNDKKNNIIQLLGVLYQKTILKSDSFKIKYSYNYNDLQTITFINTYINYDNSKTITKYIFYNIPTKIAYLDTFKINEVLNDEK